LRNSSGALLSFLGSGTLLPTVKASILAAVRGGDMNLGSTLHHCQECDTMSWTSRKRRKRNRRRLANEAAGRGGDRQKAQFLWGWATAVDWSQASLGDLALLVRAIRAEWPVPFHRRLPILNGVFSILRDKSASAEMRIAAARAYIAADRKNVELRAKEIRLALANSAR
jgi:hypothetical protein